MIVALCARECASEPYCCGGIHPIDDRLPSGFFRVDSAFLVEKRVSMKAGGDLLTDCGIREHVARDLLDRELIERHIAVESIDNPIAILPHHPALVFLITVRVGVSRKVKPRPSPSLPVLRG